MGEPGAGRHRRRLAWHLIWILVLSLVIGGEETLEGTIIIFALTRGRHLRLRIPSS